MAVRFEDTVAGNDRYLQEQIHRIVGATLGPVSVAPGEGHIRMHTDAGESVVITPANGITAYPDGVRTHLNPWMSSTRKAVARHESTLKTHGGRLDSAEKRLSGHDSTLASHGKRLGSAESTLSAQGGRLSSVESKTSQQASTLSGLSSRLGSLEGKSTASPGDLTALKRWAEARIAALEQRVIALEAWRKTLPRL